MNKQSKLEMSAQLKLKYVFTSDPNPIRASAGGADPNVINLRVMVSNPSTEPVTMESISIEIPVGEDSQRALSSNPNLPQPSFDQQTGWTISSTADTVTLTPPNGQIADYIIFSLDGIRVNDTPGVVPIRITELAPPKVMDDTSYSLVKLEADFPITRFYAEPQTLMDLDQSVVLYWDCSQQGEDFVYSLHSDSWQPDNCLNGGTCQTCSDGTAGMQTPALTNTTTFSLDVIKTDASGDRTIYQTLQTTVNVEVPSISQNSYLAQLPYLSGRIVRLHWSTLNASRCSVELQGQIIDDGAPTDTYEAGYPLVLTGEPGLYQLSVIAHAEYSQAQATFTFPEVNLGTALSTVPVNVQPQDVAVTPDGTLALVPSYDDGNFLVGYVTLIDISSGQKSSVINFSSYATQWPTAVAITPDGKLAFVTNFNSGNVAVIDMATRTLEGQQINAGTEPMRIAITPDGTLALVTNAGSDNVTMIDVAARAAKAGVNVGNHPVGIAVTPDGKLALVANCWGNNITVIDLATLQPEASTIATATGPWSVAITSDGKLALVGNCDPNNNGGGMNINVIDIATRQAEPNPIPIAVRPSSIAITPDGSLAIVASDDDGTVTVIDIASRKAIAQTISISRPNSIALTPDGKRALTTSGYNGVVTII